MSRLNAELHKIEQLSTRPDGTRDEIRTMLVCALVVGGLALNDHLRSREGPSIDDLDGPLATYRLRGADAQPTDCRSAACTVQWIAPRPVPAIERRGAHLLLPQPQLIAAPAGSVIRGTDTLPFIWRTQGEAPSGGHVLAALVSAREPNTLAQPMLVPGPGYVMSARIADSQVRLQLDGSVQGPGEAVGLAASYAGAVGRAMLDRARPRLAALEFRAMPTEWHLRLDEGSPLSVRRGAAVRLNFGSLPADSVVSRSPERFAPQAVVTALEGGQLTLTVSEQALQQLIRERVDIERNGVGEAFPERCWIEVLMDYGRPADQVWHLPLSALEGVGEVGVIWLNVAGYAVPVEVQVLGRDAETVKVAERPAALGPPISERHWQAMGPGARGAVLQTAGAAGNRLLRTDARVLLTPAQQIAPGSRLRGLDGKS